MPPVTLTIGSLRKMIKEMPDDWPVVIRDYHCDSLEWDDYECVLMGITNEQKLILLSTAHTDIGS